MSIIYLEDGDYILSQGSAWFTVKNFFRAHPLDRGWRALYDPPAWR